jgi:TonB-dependent receptor
MRSLFCTFILVLVSIVSFAQKGSVTVKVRDDQNLNVPGASLSITGIKVSGITNSTGEFTFLGLPAGKHELRISYIGYQTITTGITVAENQTSVISFSLEPNIKTGKEIVVTGDRLKGQAKALNQQKNGKNIGNIVSADQVGRFPDANIGDALKRIPGITMQNDQGEARDIIIRGMAPQLNSVTLNGDRIPSAEAENRRVQMDLIPSDMIQTIEVNKTLTPDMDGDAIGGSVNLVTRTTSNKLRLSGTLSSGFNPIRGGAVNSASYILSNSFGKKKQFGFMFNGSILNNDYGSDNIEGTWIQHRNSVYMSQMDIRRYDVRRLRRSIGGNFEYKINNRNKIQFSTIYNWRDDWENRYRLRYSLDTALTTFDANGKATGFRGRVNRQTKGGINNTRVKNTRLENQQVQNYSLNGKHIIGNNIQLDWAGSYAKASEKRPNERYANYRTSAGVQVLGDFSNPEAPFLTDTFSQKGLWNAYGFDRITEQFGFTFEENKNARIDLTIPASLLKEQKGALKFGFAYRGKFKVRDNSFLRYTPVSGYRPAIANLGVAGITANYTIRNYQPGSKYAVGNFMTPELLGNQLLSSTNNGFFTVADQPAEYLGLNYRATENIYAGYVRFDQQINDKLGIVAGVRLEATNPNYTGNVVLNETNLVNKVTGGSNYINFLPSLNIKYDFSKNTVFRFAVTSSMARPNYFDITPYRSIVSNDAEFSIGNDKLKASQSWNIDLMAEHYFSNVGILSGGVFYKNISNFIYTFRNDSYSSADYQKEFGTTDTLPGLPQTAFWSYRQPRNGENVNVFGAEVSFQRQLDFLPGFLKNLGVFVNYTYTKSSADGIFTPEGQRRTELALPGTAPHMFNGSLSYDSKWFTARIAANYAAAYLDAVGTNSFNDVFYDQQFFLDANFTFIVKKNLRIFGEMNNLTNQPLRYYQGSKERTFQLEYYRARYNFGVKFDVF